MSRGLADEELTNPFLGQPDAIAAGRVIYASKCYVCHHSSGARGPNLFATKLSDQRFLETVIQGRKGLSRRCCSSSFRSSLLKLSITVHRWDVAFGSSLPPAAIWRRGRGGLVFARTVLSAERNNP